MSNQIITVGEQSFLARPINMNPNAAQIARSQSKEFGRSDLLYVKERVESRLRHCNARFNEAIRNDRVFERLGSEENYCFRYLDENNDVHHYSVRAARAMQYIIDELDSIIKEDGFYSWGYEGFFQFFTGYEVLQMMKAVRIGNAELFEIFLEEVLRTASQPEQINVVQVVM